MKHIKLFEDIQSEYDLLIDKAKEEAKKISKEEGVVQHVNEIKPGVYKVQDWYDEDSTIASYENGIEL